MTAKVKSINTLLTPGRPLNATYANQNSQARQEWLEHTNAQGMNGEMAQNNGNVYRMKDAQQEPLGLQMGSDSFSRFVIVLFPAIECLHFGVIRRSQRLFQQFFFQR